MSTEQEKNQAVQFAITDIGLTEDEAKQAFYDFYPNNDYNYCETCGKKLIDFGDNKNCNDDIEDEFCDKCWAEFEKQLEQFKIPCTICGNDCISYEYELKNGKPACYDCYLEDFYKKD